MMALETGPMGTHLQGHLCATAFVILVLMGLVSETTYVTLRLLHKRPQFSNQSLIYNLCTLRKNKHYNIAMQISL